MGDYFGGAGSFHPLEPGAAASPAPQGTSGGKESQAAGRTTLRFPLILHLLAPGSLALAILMWFLLHSPHTRHDLISEIAGWGAIVLGLFMALFFASADLMRFLRARRTRRT